uniref:Uncharacterized protein n=1 Tax=Salvator merianae TaxID=96440 RepID=A0A8D0BPA7_SALMN
SPPPTHQPNLTVFHQPALNLLKVQHPTITGGLPEEGLKQCGGTMEETFVASSTGEGMEVINMAESDDSQRLGNAAVKDILLDLPEVLAVIMDEENLNIYLCFMIAY